MKPRFIGLFVAVAIAVLGTAARAASTAQAVLANESLRINTGSCSCGIGPPFKMHWSSFYTENPQMANREVAPLPQPAPYSYWSYMLFEDISTAVGTTYVELNLPLGADANANGTPDFLEVSQEVSTSSDGRYAIIWLSGYGQLTFNWSRAAGSSVGSCVVYMNDQILGQMGPFTHTFELTNYTGELNVTPGATSVAGTISLSKNDGSGQSLSGAVALTKSPTNAFNLLTLSATTLTNETESLSFSETDLTRDPVRPTVYTGTLVSGGAFGSWKISIVDTNDADADGIPNFSDNPVSTPRQPSLMLARSGANLVMRISGDVGRTHHIREAASPTSVSWSLMQSVTLTNDPQIVTLPLPTTSPRFWRVEAQ